MATSFIGKKISLISHSDIRYSGTLAGIDANNSTIQLQNVHSMGTEGRRPPEEFIPPTEQPFQYIIFRASEVKDLAVEPEQHAPLRTMHDDPAIIRSGPPPMDNGSYGEYPQYPQQSAPQPVPQDLSQPPHPRHPQPIPPSNRPPQSNRPIPSNAVPGPAAVASPANGNGVAAEGRTASRASSGTNGRRLNANSLQTAAASLETVERALGDLRVSNTQTRNGAPRRNGRGQETKIHVPTTDFDFEKSNALFDKSAVAPRSSNAAKAEDEKTNPSDEEKDKAFDGLAASHNEKDKQKEAESAYNPRKSFFDSLSSSASTLNELRGGRGGGRRGQGRSRREEEREKNVATFGEPGMKSMSSGSYAGRRGGRGGRRGLSSGTGR